MPYIHKTPESLFMRRAIDLAMRAEPRRVSPNPLVGAVLVYEDKIIAEGYHEEVGKAHAEVNCLNHLAPENKKLLPQSTLYVTLEPCAHEGRTGSCAKMLVREKVGRVVIGAVDPNPLVAGAGIRILQEAGIAVQTGVLEEACRDVAKVFMTNQELKRPYILLKWARSADGFIDLPREARLRGREATKLSTPFTSLLGHRLRSQYAAIIVGRNTFELDRPRLDNRLWPLSGYSPQRILLSGTNSQGEVPISGEWKRLQDVSYEAMEMLYREEGIDSIIVEGGTQTLNSFLEKGLWDEIREEEAPFNLVKGIVAPLMPHDAKPICTHKVDGRVIRYYRRAF